MDEKKPLQRGERDEPARNNFGGAAETDDATRARTKARARGMRGGFMEQPVIEIVAEHFAQAWNDEAENENVLGETLKNRYRLVKVIKQGGMGIVFEARDLRQKDAAQNGEEGARVAVKKTLLNSSESELLRRQFESEARLLEKLNHPALPKFIDYFTDERGYQYLVMEFVPGEDFAEKLRENPRGFPIEQVLQWADELLDVLEHLHSQTPPVIHRDIKPANLKLSEKNQIVLLDFGIAKEFSEQTNDTQTRGIAAATRDYASPEQLQGKPTNQSTDIFSAAATLFHLATGVPAVSADERGKRVELGRPDPLLLDAGLIKNVPLKIAAVLHGAMSLRKEERPSAAKMREALLKARLLVSLYDALASIASNAAETFATALKNAAAMLATVRSGLKTRLTIAARSTTAKFKNPKEKLSAAAAACLMFFGELVQLLIFKIAPAVLFIFLLNYLQKLHQQKQNSYAYVSKTVPRSGGIPYNSGNFAPASPPSFSGNPTRSGAESLGLQDYSELSSDGVKLSNGKRRYPTIGWVTPPAAGNDADIFWTAKRLFYFSDFYNEYGYREQELEELNFSPANFKAIKRLAREQIQLLNDFAALNRQAVKRNDENTRKEMRSSRLNRLNLGWGENYSLSSDDARNNIRRAEVLHERAAVLLKIDSASVNTIKARREQLKLRADLIELEMPARQIIRSPSSETYSSTTNVNKPVTGLK